MPLYKKVRLPLLVTIALVVAIKASQTSEGNSRNSLVNTTSTPPSLQPKAFHFNGVLRTSSETARNRSNNYNNSQANTNFWSFEATSSVSDKTNCECYNPSGQIPPLTPFLLSFHGMRR